MTLVAPQKKHSSHKKRTGQHQRRHKNFHKTYWPYLPLFMIVGVGLACNSLWSGAHGVLGSKSNLSAINLLQQTNEQREQNGERDLVLDYQLSSAAQAKANDMVQRNYWSHNTPDGQTPWSFIAASGYSYQMAGENLAYGFGDASGTLTAWMNSPEHRANILNTDYSQVGFGLASSPDFHGGGPATVVVAMYAKPSNSAAPAYTQSSIPSQVQDIDNISQPVSRVQLLTGGRAPWSLMVVLMIGAVAGAFIVLRHIRFWHKLLVKSEAFVIDHPLLDIAVVIIGAAALILGQAAGFTL